MVTTKDQWLVDDQDNFINSTVKRVNHQRNNMTVVEKSGIKSSLASCPHSGRKFFKRNLMNKSKKHSQMQALNRTEERVAIIAAEETITPQEEGSDGSF